MLSPVLRQAGEKILFTPALPLFIERCLDRKPYKVSWLIVWV